MARSLARLVLPLGPLAFVMIACASDPQPAQQPQGQTQPPAGPQQGPPPQGPCGVQLFATPACQGALDQVCCPISQECGKDPGCARFASCMMGCKGQNDNCANGCGVRARYEYCNGVCQGKGGDCVTTCAAQKTSLAEPTTKWLMIAQCSKNVRYPSGVRCNDST